MQKFTRTYHKNDSLLSQENVSFSDKLLRVLKFFAENNTGLFFFWILLIGTYSVFAPFIVEGGCIGKYDELTNSINLFHKYSFSTKFIRSLHP